MSTLTGKVVAVVGASSGIGAAVAERAAADGAAIVLGARRAAEGEAVAAAVRKAGGQAVFQVTDATVEADVAALVDRAVREFGRLDGAVNNVGGVVGAGPTHELAAEDWEASLALNLTSAFLGLKHQVPAILAAGGGSIVTNASLLGVVGAGGMAAYTAAKHGVVGLTRAVALEHAAAGLRVNALVTHAVDTPMFQGMIGTPMTGEQLAGLTPAARLSRPEEVAAFVAFLLSDDARFVTGAALPIDGGQSAR